MEQLETLLLLHSQRDRDWSPGEIAKELRTAAISAGNRVVDLAARGLLAVDQSRYRFAPSSGELDAAVAELARVYRERPVTVIEIIFSRPSEVIRTFADAFKLRRDE
ncbi:hypothetical protein [Sandaracinus amylolyticus]|uniref:MarR family transcriptional regulator n=1 Tax=Sandaracinus amylolyticus TaxID=927083 RepID=A0A0F6W0X1_9BACT|nr:hypothetical protein [Sandaracinus amylolyticus]AKF04421.1 hypothetical protein DB32_001570 [Sandaracinus amylolyticus]